MFTVTVLGGRVDYARVHSQQPTRALGARVARAQRAQRALRAARAQRALLENTPL